MLAKKFIPVVIKQVVRHTTRSLLTVAGVGCAMFLFCAIEGMQRGVTAATETSAKDSTLIVYRKDRFCPEASQLPEHYGPLIAKIPGVTQVMPMRVMPTSCATTVDVIVFRGVPVEQFAETDGLKLEILSGDIQTWVKRRDAALIGEDLATRRGLTVGSSFQAAGLQAYVAGIFRSDNIQDQSVAYVNLRYLQQTRGDKGGEGELGVVTQFRVNVDDPKSLDSIASTIDDLFHMDQSAPTQTFPEKAFVAKAAAGAVEMVGFTGYMAMACLAAVLALVANAIVLSVQDRVRDIAILQTLGYRRGLISRMIVAEGLLLSVTGGFAGTIAAWLVATQIGVTISAEGVSIPMLLDGSVVAMGLGISIFVGVFASLVPAMQAAKREIATCFRAV